MKKTVLPVLTALVKSNVKSRNSSLGFTENPFFFFFTAILKDFHSEGALTVYLLLADKKTNTKTTTKKNMWSVIYRIGRYFVGIARYISYDFLFVEQELGALQTILQNKQIKAHYMIL